MVRPLEKNKYKEMKKEESAGLAIVFDGEILLAHATGRKWTSGYGIPKGHLEKGETPIDAAIRETEEEIGVKVPKELINNGEFLFPKGHGLGAKPNFNKKHQTLVNINLNL